MGIERKVNFRTIEKNWNRVINHSSKIGRETADEYEQSMKKEYPIKVWLS